MQPADIYLAGPPGLIRQEAFVDILDAYTASIDAISSEVFRGDAKFEVYVLPAEEGSFWIKLGVVAATIWGGVQVLETDIAKGFSRGVFGEEPAFYAEEAGKWLRDWTEETSAQQVVEKAAVDSTALMLSSEPGLVPGIYGGAAGNIQFDSARNQFFEAISETQAVTAVSFPGTPAPFIPRDRFPRLIREYRPDSGQEFTVPSFVTIYLASPNWLRDDARRQWMGKLRDGRRIYFQVADDNFWRLVQNGKIKSGATDVITAQMVSRKRKGDRRRNYVVSVLEYNGIRVSPERDLAELMAIYDEIRNRSDADDGQGDLGI